MVLDNRPGLDPVSFFGKKRVVAHFFFAMAVFFFLMVFSSLAFASSGGEDGPKGWGSTDTYRVMNFAVLAVGLFFVLRKPVSQGLSDRIEEIKDQLSALELKKKEAEVHLKQYDAQLAALEKEAEDLIAEYVLQGNETKVRILTEAKLAAGKLQEQAQKNIAREFAQAKNSIMDKIMDKALAEAGEIMRKKITEKDHNKLVDEYLKKVIA